MPDNPIATLVNWPAQGAARLDREPFLTPHSMQLTDLISNDRLEALLDEYPRRQLQVFTMGQDPFDNSQWFPVDTRDVSGKEILSAVANGRLWVKLLRIDNNSAAWKGLVDTAYSEIRSSDAEFRPEFLRPLLLISSPGALVFYHADPNPTMLWQLRGRKRVWVYPVNDDLVQPELLEQIFAGEVDEEAPYRSDFDAVAKVFDLEPGQMLAWPLNAPHRVVNYDSVNISLSVPFGTIAGQRKSELFQANMALRRKLGFKRLSTAEAGIIPGVKRFSFKVARRLGLNRYFTIPRPPYRTRLRIDSAAPGGVASIDEVTTLF